MNNRNLTPCFKNSCKSTTACETCADNVVCGHAVERASRGKSGCECKCRFPNTGGLHRSSGDAPLETHHSPHLPWGHVHESNSPSSRQTKFAAVASGHEKREFTSHSTKNKKYETACETCVDNVVCGHAVERAFGGSLDVNASVASQTPEDFTAHLEMHSLKHIASLCEANGKRPFAPETELTHTHTHLICHGATCTSLTLRLLEEPKLQLLPTYTKGKNLLNIP
jgi:hypothetical protein